MHLYIWGIGNSTTDLLRLGVREDVEGFIETKVSTPYFQSKPVKNPSEVHNYDVIIVPSTYSEEIYSYANELQMDMNKFIFLNFCYPMVKYNNSVLAFQVLSEINYQRYLIAYNFREKSFYVQDREKYIQMNKRPSFDIHQEDERPILTDKYVEMGCVHQYFWQDLWAAKLVYKNKPANHFDIGSRLDGFISHILATGIPIKVIDVRPFPVKIPGMETIVADATMLQEIENSSIESLSALCSLEHFGLGRYGDEINPEACFQCFKQIQKKVKPGGKIYISVPIGKEKIQFNAHRIFYASTVIENFNECQLLEFSTCDEKEIKRNTPINKYDENDNSGEIFGLFYFQKRKVARKFETNK